MRVLGIDPGNYHTGFAVVESPQQCLYIESLSFDKKSAYETRLNRIYEHSLYLLEHYAPKVIAIEDCYLNKNVRSLVQLARIQGLIIALALSRRLSFLILPPTLIKKHIVGKGNASKEQVQRMLKHVYRLSNTASLDAYDALAVAFTALHYWKP